MIVCMGVRRRTRRRSYLMALAAIVVTLVAVLASCVGKAEAATARSVVDEFVAALNEGDLAGAAQKTSYPNAAEDLLQEMFDGLSPEETTFKITQFMDLGSTSSYFTLSTLWNFGDDRDWTYQAQGSVKQLSVGWRIAWDPAVIAPMLGEGSNLRFDHSYTGTPVVRDNYGGLLMNEQTINSIVLDPALMPDPVNTTNRLAEVIAPVAPLITGESMRADLEKKPGEKVTAVRLRDNDFAYLESRFNIPGVVVEKEPTLIMADRRISTPLLDTYRQVWKDHRDRFAGWAVHSDLPGGEHQIHAGVNGPPAPDVTATLDPRVQLAAIEAVVSSGSPAAVVAIQPSTGAVLAAAQNNQAYEKGPFAFDRLVPAGTALDLVRTAAAADRGVGEDSLSNEDVEYAAQQLGIGMKYTVPGLTQQTAVFTANRDGVDQVMASRDEDLPAVTPFGMAVLAASIARGSAAAPMIVHGQPGTTNQSVNPLPGHVVDRLRGSMRENVLHGHGSLLRGVPDLMGMTARSGGDRWFFGSQGDLAFAVYVSDPDGGDRAVQMTDRFFTELGKPATA